MIKLAPQHGSATQVAQQLRGIIVSGRFPKGSQLPSTRDLSRRFEVSTRTINHVLRILESEALIVCEPRKRARVTFAGRSGKRVVTIVHDQEHVEPRSTLWYGTILMHVDQRLMEAGYQPTRMLAVPDDLADEQRTLAMLLDSGDDPIAGVLLRGGLHSRDFFQQLQQADVPWVTIHQATRQTFANFVSADLFEAGRVVGALLARSGRKRVCVIHSQSSLKHGHMDLPTGVQVGYVNDGGDVQDVSVRLMHNVTEQVAYDLMLRLYEQDRSVPDAVVCGGDYYAIGVLKACRKLGLHVPEQVAIVGGTGLELSAYVDPPLTVIDQSMQQLGFAAADMLIEQMRTGSRQVVGQMIPPRIVLRETFQVEPKVIDALRQAEPDMTIQICQQQPDVQMV